MFSSRLHAMVKRSNLPVLALLIAKSISLPCNGQTTTDEMLDAVIARGTALFSAKIAFEVKTTVERGKQEELDHVDNYILSVTGQDWILRQPGVPDFSMHRDDSTTRFYQTTSDRGVYRAMHMAAPETIDELIGGDYTFAVTRNGTFWYRSQLTFVDKQRTRVERRAGEPIDGQPTVHFRWRVDTHDLDEAIVVLSPAIRKDLACYLDVYAAPNLGYAIPRIDYLTLDGQLARRYQSSDFVEVDSGLFFPKSTRCIAVSDGQRRTTAFQVSSIEHVNQDLPEQEFDVRIPPDTRVRDSRPGSPQVVFHLGDQKGVDDVAQMLGTAGSKSRHFNFRMACLTANGLLVLLLLFVWIRRQCCSS